MNIEEIESHIQKIPDHPKPGILFYDISTLIFNAQAFVSSIDHLIKSIEKFDFDKIAAIDARGFIFASAVAYKLGLGVVMIRKKNKLPGKTISHEYDLEYGTDTLEINLDVSQKKIVLIDDLLATGGTANADYNLIHSKRGNVVGFLFLIDLNNFEDQ